MVTKADTNGSPVPPAGQLVRCVKDPARDRLWLVCAVRRTYTLDRNRCHLADEQQPLVIAPSFATDTEGRLTSLEDDTDFYPPKESTDVVVRGSVVPRHRTGEILIGVEVGRSVRTLSVSGERHVEVSASGTVRFSDPASIECVPLTYSHAYGGHDAHALAELTPPPNEHREDKSPRRRGLYAYPRNKVGSGYFIDIDRRRADGSLLPQIEDPADRLVPERLFVRRAREWINAPIPGSFQWMAHAWYPRIMRFVGGHLEHDPPAGPIREALFPDGHDLTGAIPSSGAVLRAYQGASPGLACERLRGGELILLRNLVPGHAELRSTVPAETPRFQLRPPGVSHVFEPDPVMQTLRIDLERRLLSITWCGAVRLLAVMSPKQLAETRISVEWR